MRLNSFSIAKKLLLYLLFVLLIGISFISYSVYSIDKIASLLEKDTPGKIRELKDNSRLDSLAQLIRYYDEVLTQSAHNYAFTSDKKWKDRYNENAANLETAIKEAETDGGIADRNIFKTIDTANSVLIEMEAKAFSLVEKGQAKEAVEILESRSYNDQKKIYEEALKEYVGRRGRGYSQALEASTDSIEMVNKQAHDLAAQSSLLMISVGAIASILFTIVSLLFIRILNSQLTTLTQTVEAITAGDLSKRVNVSSGDEIGRLAVLFNEMVAKLQEANLTLESRVNERTREIAKKASELEVINESLEKTKKASLNVLEDLHNEKASLAMAKAKDEAILGSLGEGVIVADKTGKLTYSNQMAKELLGVSEVKAGVSEGATAYGLIDPATNRVFETGNLPLARALRGESVDKIEVIVRNPKANKDIHLSTNGRSVKDPDGTILGAVVTFGDISKEKEVDKAKTEFVSLASHQLRTPLSAMKWFSEMLLAGDAGQLTDEQKGYVQNMYDSNERMVALVNGLLNIARIESGRLILEPEPSDLKILLEKVVLEVKQKSDAKKQQIIVSVHENLPKINIDPKLIREVYINLLTNSIKYTPEGGEITVFISKKDNFLISQVSDNGIGIPVSQQERVFTKFFRADNALKAEGEGTGLGLYLIKSIVEASGGKIWFTSSEDRGTSFFFSLPLSGSIARKGEVSLNS